MAAEEIIRFNGVEGVLMNNEAPVLFKSRKYVDSDEHERILFLASIDGPAWVDQEIIFNFCWDHPEYIHFFSRNRR